MCTDRTAMAAKTSSSGYAIPSTSYPSRPPPTSVPRSPVRRSTCGYACTTSTCAPTCSSALAPGSIFVPTPNHNHATKIILPSGSIWTCSKQGCQHSVITAASIGNEKEGKCESVRSEDTEVCIAVCDQVSVDAGKDVKIARGECWEECDGTGRHCGVVCKEDEA